MSKPKYIIVQAETQVDSWNGTTINTDRLARDVNEQIESGYVVSGGITFVPTVNKTIILIQPMTLNPIQSVGNGTKRRRSRKNV